MTEQFKFEVGKCYPTKDGDKAFHYGVNSMGVHRFAITTADGIGAELALITPYPNIQPIEWHDWLTQQQKPEPQKLDIKPDTFWRTRDKNGDEHKVYIATVTESRVIGCMLGDFGHDVWDRNGNHITMGGHRGKYDLIAPYEHEDVVIVLRTDEAAVEKVPVVIEEWVPVKASGFWEGSTVKELSKNIIKQTGVEIHQARLRVLLWRYRRDSSASVATP